MNFSAFKDWALLGLLSGAVGILLVGVLDVQALNIKMEKIVVEFVETKKDVDDHEDRIRSLEVRKN